MTAGLFPSEVIMDVCARETTCPLSQLCPIPCRYFFNPANDLCHGTYLRGPASVHMPSLVLVNLLLVLPLKMNFITILSKAAVCREHFTWTQDGTCIFWYNLSCFALSYLSFFLLFFFSLQDCMVLMLSGISTECQAVNARFLSI